MKKLTALVLALILCFACTALCSCDRKDDKAADTATAAVTTGAAPADTTAAETNDTTAAADTTGSAAEDTTAAVTEPAALSAEEEALLGNYRTTIEFGWMEGVTEDDKLALVEILAALGEALEMEINTPDDVLAYFNRTLDGMSFTLGLRADRTAVEVMDGDDTEEQATWSCADGTVTVLIEGEEEPEVYTVLENGDLVSSVNMEEYGIAVIARLVRVTD